MDKNSIIGLLLIGAILIGFSMYNQPSDEEVTSFKKQQDSINLVKKQHEALIEKANTSVVNNAAVISQTTTTVLSDSAKQVELSNKYGDFAAAAKGVKKDFSIENEDLKLTFSSLGGRLIGAELKNYKTYDSLPLNLFDEDSSNFSFSFFDNNREINTRELYFIPESETFNIKGENQKTFSLKTTAGNQSIEFKYTLKGTGFLVDYEVVTNGMEDILRSNQSELALNWKIKALGKEKTLKQERMKTTVFYKYANDAVDYISETKSEKENLEAKINWISFKQQYFSAAIISKEGFPKDNADIETQDLTSSKYTKELTVNLMVPMINGSSLPIQFYFGPNKYHTLKETGIDAFEDQIDLGWVIFRWVNEYVVIQIFDFLNQFNINYGIIILILTLAIKLALSPITYKTYVSGAKTKILKPEIDALNEKFKDDAMKKQQATMALYKQTGVNPMAGCIPMLIQMPILYAMFRFFPAAIELRQQGFLWAEDLSAYDSIYNLGFSIPFYGDHISLFTLLMAGSTMLYSMTNSSMSMSGPQASQMKMMMYLMPIMMLGFFNNYAAGLSLYYFYANIISVGQQYFIKKWFVDEKALRAKIEANKKNPKMSKKSKFQKRLEDMAKKKGYQVPKKK